MRGGQAVRPAHDGHIVLLALDELLCHHSAAGGRQRQAREQPGGGGSANLDVGGPSELVVANRGEDGERREIGEREPWILPGCASMESQDDPRPGDEDPKSRNAPLADHRPDTRGNQGGHEGTEVPPVGGRERVVEPGREAVGKLSVAGRKGCA